MTANAKSGRHLYGRGWFGLIPLVGGVIGLGLIILGIFKYKDKKLILIGIGALSFTVIIYSSIFYTIQYSDSLNSRYTQISQEYLNSLVADIEFYKQQNGIYPDSLEELLQNNKYAQIDDPLLLRSFHETHTKFNYKRVDNSYVLFSSGIDKKPNTPDDIYPTVILHKRINTSSTNH